MRDADSRDRSLAYEKFKPVRNSLRKYGAEEVVLKCVSHLMGPQADDIEEIRHYPPHYLLLLAKWAAMHGDMGRPERSLGETQFKRLVNLMHDLAGAVRMPSEYANPLLFFRGLAYQQFWLQEGSSAARIARQNMLFGGLVCGDPLARRFVEQTGVAISDFVELALGLIAKFYTSSDWFVTRDWFAPVGRAYPKGTIDSFLSALSLDKSSLRDYLLRSETGHRSVNYEFLEQTPLKRYPLLRRGDRYYCYSRKLLAQALEGFVYNVLRSSGPEAFMNRYGTMFERYMEKCLRYSGVAVLVERELRQLPGCKGKTVDFLIRDGGANVFMDAKAVEFGYLGMVTHKPEVIRDKLKPCVLKAMAQAYDTAQCISQAPTVGWPPGGSGPNYLLVITHDDLYLGSGREVYGAIAREAMDRLVQEHAGTVWIPFENMYFLSIDELDTLVEYVKRGTVGYADLLRHAVEVDSAPQTRKFLFRQHLPHSPEGEPVPGYLQDELGVVRERIAARFLTDEGKSAPV